MELQVLGDPSSPRISSCTANLGCENSFTTAFFKKKGESPNSLLSSCVLCTLGTQELADFDPTVVMVQANADVLDNDDVDESSGPEEAFEDDSSWEDDEAAQQVPHEPVDAPPPVVSPEERHEESPPCHMRTLMGISLTRECAHMAK